MTTCPTVYVVRHADGYALYPFDDGIAGRLSRGTLTAEQTLAAIRYLGVSLIISSDGSDVRWINGDSVTVADLDAMAIV